MANFYCDPDTIDGTNDGTYDHPFKTLAHINGHSFDEGDCLYFKVGTTLAINGTTFLIEWGGTESTPVTIGAYYGEGLFGLNGGARPILDCNWSVVGDYAIALNVKDTTGYTTIKDIEIKDAYSIALQVGHLYASAQKPAGNNIISNVYINVSGAQGIVVARSSYNLVEDCATYLTSSRLRDNKKDGAAIEINALSDAGTTNYNTVRGCTVNKCQEGIGIYKGARYTTIENNTVYETGKNAIYSANSRYGTIRNNLVYTMPEIGDWQFRDYITWLIFIDCEGHVPSIIKETGDWEVYGNYIAGGGQGGIKVANNGYDVGVYTNNMKIHDNVIVDCGMNFNFINNAFTGGTGNEVYDNYSFIYTADLVHINDMNPAGGITFANNSYNTDIVGVSGAAATTQQSPPEALVDTVGPDDGWRSLVPGGVSTDDFAIVGASPPGPSGSSLNASNAYGGATYTPSRIYILDEATGSTLNDLSSSEQDATLTNPAWVTNGLQMAATGSMIAVPVPTLTTFSIGLAFTSVATSGQDYAKFFYYYNTNVRDLQLERYTSDTEIRSDINSVTAAFTPVTDAFDMYYHFLLFTSNGSNSRKLYIDGDLMGEDTESFTYPTFTGNMYFGSKSDGSRQINATFHLIAIWPDTLTAADALSLYQDYDQMITDGPSRTLSTPSEPNYVGAINGSLAINIIDGSKSITTIFGS